MFFSKCRLTFSRLRSVVSQKIELFIATAVIASHPTYYEVSLFSKPQYTIPCQQPCRWKVQCMCEFRSGMLVLKSMLKVECLYNDGVMVCITKWWWHTLVSIVIWVYDVLSFVVHASHFVLACEWVHKVQTHCSQHSQVKATSRSVVGNAYLLFPDNKG
jgi:hypothetical protein